MYDKHPCFVTPDDKTLIWRYINFSKFVSLLESSTLFFPSALKLAEDDPYEGSCARGNLEFDKLIKSEQKIRQQYRTAVKDIRKGVYINSWYVNEHESAAMWKCYAVHKDGVAIQSTVERFKKAISNDPTQIFIGMIGYTDYDISAVPEGNVFYNFLHKRKSFEHESELRAITMGKDFDQTRGLPAGVGVSINVDILIEKILIAPTAPEWIKELAEAITLRYGLTKAVKKSSLHEEGLW